MKYKKTIVVSVVILAISFILIALFNSTYSLFSDNDYGAEVNNYSTGLLSVVVTSKSESISLANVLPMSDDEGVESESYVFTVRNVGNLDYKFNIKLLSTGESATTFSPQYIKLQIDDGDVVSLSQLSNSIVKRDVILAAGESIDIAVKVWLSIDTPNSEMGKSFNSKIVVDGQAINTDDSSVNNYYFVDYLKHLYNSGTKKAVINNNISYNYVESQNLMNDRLGNSSGSANAGNIRYYGANPKNYIYFNCDDYSNQSSDTCELWRIIGVFDGKVKIVKDTPIGSYSWDYKSNGTYNNDWSTSTLKELLNSGYYNGATSYKYYNNSTTPITINFKTNGMGITPNTRNGNFIVSNTWNLGGTNIDISNGFSDVFYEAEIGKTVYGKNAIIWDGKIAIPYVSDYGYAGDFTKSCNSAMGNSSLYSKCINYNWLLYNKNYNKMTLTHNRSSSNILYSILPSGVLNNNLKSNTVSPILPTLYLNPKVSFNYAGDGSVNNPYQLIGVLE